MLLGGTTELCDVASGLGDRDSVAELFPLLKPSLGRRRSTGDEPEAPVAAYLGLVTATLTDKAALSTAMSRPAG